MISTLNFIAPNIKLDSIQDVFELVFSFIPAEVIACFDEDRHRISVTHGINQIHSNWALNNQTLSLIFVGKQADLFLEEYKKCDSFINICEILSSHGWRVNSNQLEIPNLSITSYLPEYFDDNGLLKGTFEKTTEFNAGDSEELFTKNLKKLPSDWYYRRRKISYIINDQFYRCPDLNTIDWENSAVLFGCSHAGGVGLPECDTISSKLSTSLGIPVVNLGCPGTGVDYTYINNVLLRKNFPQPKIVINLWSEFSTRHTIFNKKNATLYGPWNLSETNSILPDEHMAVQMFTYEHSCKILWKDTIYLSYSAYSNTAYFLGIPEISWVDQARDLSHPGGKTVSIFVEKITRDIQLLSKSR